jgi:hypothetical protein
MSIQMIESGSSAFQFFGYDSENQKLQIQFHDGRKIVYQDVPDLEWLAFKNASSKGKHYNTCIKGVYTVDEEATLEANK